MVVAAEFHPLEGRTIVTVGKVILSSYWSTLSILSYDWLQVRDATLAVSRVDDYGASARLLSATTLRNVLGTKSLEVTRVTRDTCTLHVLLHVPCIHVTRDIIRGYCWDARPSPGRCRTCCTRPPTPGASLWRG